MSEYGEHDHLYTRADFETIRALIHEHAGITLADGKQQLVYSRLSRRLRALGLESFSDYISLLAPGASEWQLFINALTTNLTAFFREPHHFPVLAKLALTLPRRPLRLWSAAASTGEEPYSIAITMAEVFGRLDAPVEILATDVDTQVLEHARSGIYPLERLERMPLERKRQFFQRGGGEREGFARVQPVLQQLITFRQLNLLSAQWPPEQPFDAIFCRNVMIYFDKPTQRRLLQRFMRALAPDGLFFAGHSESFFHSTDIMASIGKTVYRPTSPRSEHDVA